MNNLYGHAMSQYLPYANFKWVNNINEIEQKLMKIRSNSSTRYIYSRSRFRSRSEVPKRIKFRT